METIQFHKGEFAGNSIQTLHEVDSQQESLNARLLLQAGFIKQEVAGVYTYTRLGFEVLSNVQAVVREHMRQFGAEILMPSLHSPSNWEQTGRLETMSSLFEARGANNPSQKQNSGRYILGPTHEEIVTPFAKQYVKSYRDFPASFFQFQTKFRNEARAKSGLLRGREFLMKDMYSFHPDEEDLLAFYEAVKQGYLAVFRDLGIGDDTFVTLASGGDFTTGFSHEFQTLLPNGEDTIYLDRENNIAYNREVVNDETAERLGVNFDEMEVVKAAEVGNIFPLNTKFSEPFGLTYADKNGAQQTVYMGCYGIGVSRIMGVIAEKFADEKGLVWPDRIAPARFHIVSLAKTEQDPAYQKAMELYGIVGTDALLDTRSRVGIGQKLADADIIGCPIRVIVSAKSIKEGGVEVKMRIEPEAMIMTIEELVRLTGGVRKHKA